MTPTPSARELELLAGELERLEDGVAGPPPHTRAVIDDGIGVAALAKALHVSRSSIMITDARLDRPGPTIRYVNPAFERLTGYTPDEVIGRDPRLLQGPRTDRRVLDRLRADLESTGSFEGQTINYRKDGTPFVMSWRISAARRPDGTVEAYVAVQDDRTDAWLDRIRATEAVTALQRTLLAARPDPAHGVELAMTYRPADDRSRVGGDWYDVVECDGTVHLVVGDVAGHGVGAAADMGKFRFALDCLLRAGREPGDALATMRAALRREQPQFATLAIATLDPARTTLEVRTVGHPAVVVLSQGRAHQVRSADPLLGVGAPEADEALAPARLPVQPGDVIVLFTDGLVETPTTTIVEGTELLARRLEALGPIADPVELVDTLVEQLLDGRRPTDDLAVLVARLT